MLGSTGTCDIGNRTIRKQSPIRSHGPYQQIAGTWLIRRLSPDSNSIEIDELPKESDTEVLLSAMGLDTANVPLGLKNSQTILSHLHKMKPNWLRSSAKDMASIVEHEWKEYKAS